MLQGKKNKGNITTVKKKKEGSGKKKDDFFFPSQWHIENCSLIRSDEIVSLDNLVTESRLLQVRQFMLCNCVLSVKLAINVNDLFVLLQ